MKQAHFRWIPKCKHEKFVATCLWCADLERIYREQVHELTKTYSGSSPISAPAALLSQQEIPSEAIYYPCIIEYPDGYEQSGRWESHKVLIKYDAKNQQEVYLNKYDLALRLVEQDLRAKYGISNEELEELARVHAQAIHHDAIED